jgi:hypothetical protein
MKILSAVIFSLLVSNSFAQNWDNPVQPFDATAPRVHNGPISIEWRVVDNVGKSCDEFSRKHGNAGFANQDIQGCAFWWGPTCVIITKKKPTMHTVGHEIRHCFYGQWH